MSKENITKWPIACLNTSRVSADEHGLHDYVQADQKIDPDGEDLPKGRLQEITSHKVEVRAMNAATTQRSNWLHET
jgi:hypothetical protein